MTGSELRASILQAAVQGKLVPQDPSDEPASALLERIREERRALVKAKKAKAPKGGESIITRYSDGTVWETRGKGKPVEITDEVPFDIPEGWEWARIGDISNFGTCENVEYQDVSDGTWTLELEQVEKDSGIVLEKRYKCGGVGSTKHVFKAGQVLYSKLRPYLNKVVVADEDGVCTSEILPMYVCGMNANYVKAFLMNPSFLQHANANSSGTKMPRLKTDAGKLALIPIPPLAEQHRIVTKLDELMPLVERYDRLDRERTELNAGIEGAMRASVLQAAVQGRLTEREGGDEPASELLDRIREERAELVEQKKAKKPKGGESVITRYPDGTVWEQRGKGAAVDITDEVPFDIPDGWEWCRGTMLINLLSGVDLKPSEYNDRHQGIPYLTGASNFSEEGLIENRWTKAPKRVSVAGDLLFTCKGTVGAMAYNTFEEAHIARQIMAIRPFGRMNLDYIRVVLSSMVAQIKASAKGVIPGIERDAILEQLVPVPSLAEQRRIVAKLDEILPKVEQMGELAS